MPGTKSANASLELVEEIEDGKRVLSILASADAPTEVEYTLEVEGSSRTAHRGRSTISGTQARAISTVRINAADDYCARLSWRAEGGEEIVTTRGECA